jgi:hypothetical protein
MGYTYGVPVAITRQLEVQSYLFQALTPSLQQCCFHIHFGAEIICINTWKSLLPLKLTYSNYLNLHSTIEIL